MASLRRSLASLSKNKRLSPLPAPYPKLLQKYKLVRQALGAERLTLAEKILYSHLQDPLEALSSRSVRDVRGQEILRLMPDRVNMQDASAQMALLQFMSCRLNQSAIPVSVHCDHLIVGSQGADVDLARGIEKNAEIFNFLQSACRRYGLDFWPPGSGIIHQVVLENYATPGMLMLGTDSHSPNAGGLCTVTIGVGGADAVEAMVGAAWELKAPRIIGVELTGKLPKWTSPKDIILYLTGRLTVRGGTGCIIEYFGPGLRSIDCTGMATICNMGAEVGATSSIFPCTPKSYEYLRAVNRPHHADIVAQVSQTKVELPKSSTSASDSYFQFEADPSAEYDERITINLNDLEPYINGPNTPDFATPLSKFASLVKEKGWPENLEASLIGSCTNSSYQDMTRSASLVAQAQKAGLKPVTDLYVTPGSEQIRATLERDGVLDVFSESGATILANACGPCIGQWDRKDSPAKGTPNAIFSSYNRNFPGRNDGNPKTMNFLASPELVTAMAFAGTTTFNPITDKLVTPNGREFVFESPTGQELQSPYVKGNLELQPVSNPPDPSTAVDISPDSTRLAMLEAFDPYPSGSELTGLRVLIKTIGKCTTDTISAAGPWLAYKGHLPNISSNTLMTATNADTGEVNAAYDTDGSRFTIPELAFAWRKRGQEWLIVADHNYGEGSAREHAALQPRYLGARIVVAKSLARIHETNLKKQGVVPLTFERESDYDLMAGCDLVETRGLFEVLSNGGRGDISLRVRRRSGHADADEFVDIPVRHTFTADQAAFVLAGSALNLLAQRST